MKGGIGSSSRLVKIGGKTYTVGALLMTNFGKPGNLTICGRRIADLSPAQPDVGSVIMILATDLPLSARQLGRCARRAQNGLARTGSYTGNGSGEIALMFSTANRIPHRSEPACCRAVFCTRIRWMLFLRQSPTVWRRA